MRYAHKLRSLLPFVLTAATAACASDPDAPELDDGSSDESGSDSDASASSTAGTTGPGTTEPGTTEPGTTEPGTTEPADDDSSGSEGETDGAESSSDDGADGSTGEPAIPTVLDATPADGDVGVRSDAVFVIRFSEAMDQAASQAAYQSASIPAAAVTFMWNDDGDEMTITPNAPLVYAGGGGPDEVDATAYGFTITTAARSLDGVMLADDVAVSFTTLRQLDHVLEIDAERTGNVAQMQGPLGSHFFGDRGTNEPVRYAVTFDLTELAPGVVEVGSAQFRAAWTSQSGNPWADLGGGTVFQHVVFDAIDDAFDAPVTGQAAGLFGSVNDTDVLRDASAQLGLVLDDPDTYGDALQLRARWVLDTNTDNGNDSVSLIRDDLELVVSYLAP